MMGSGKTGSAALPAPAFQLITDGNSFMSVAGNPWPCQIAPLLPDWLISNYAFPGQTISQCIAKAPDPAVHRTGVKTVVTTWEYFNAIYKDGWTGAQCWAGLQTWAAIYTSLGCKVVLFDCPFEGMFTSTQEQARADFNALILANWQSIASGIVRVADGFAAHAPYFFGIHPSTEGHAYIAATAAPVIAAVAATF